MNILFIIDLNNVAVTNNIIYLYVKFIKDFIYNKILYKNTFAITINLINTVRLCDSSIL